MTCLSLVKALGSKLEPKEYPDEMKTADALAEADLEHFDQLDELGKICVARVFLKTAEVGKDSAHHRRYAKVRLNLGRR